MTQKKIYVTGIFQADHSLKMSIIDVRPKLVPFKSPSWWRILAVLLLLLLYTKYCRHYSTIHNTYAF